MIEVYLFVHPLCPECLASEKRILQMVKNEQRKIQFKFLPLLNLQTFQRYLSTTCNHDCNLNDRNKLFEDSYSAALDYKAMQLQGKKKGQQFLMALQEAVQHNKNYSEELVKQTVIDLHGDWEMFTTDRQSENVKESFETDQIIAKEMSVSFASSMVYFNYTCDQDYGILVEEHPTDDILADLLAMDQPETIAPLVKENTVITHQNLADTYLRLLEN
ncbi:DsbA family protein [Vagococcus sp. PNs007]|uniref:DsbA family protein n=1 Tax=Vagococcus proximus TaxID=2991417 RepID=A0ABT5WZS1_9ENTE|nr:DsbA family protein [Vagococcus proximus]MDF0479253.1 DsbA family protein [Vagococcus proximus]